MSAAPQFPWFAVGLMAMAVLAALVVTLLLVAHRKSRPFGVALLGFGVAAVVVVGILGAWLSGGSDDVGYDGASRATLDSGDHRNALASIDASVAEAAPPYADAVAESSQPNGRVFRALGRALAEGFKQAKDDEKAANVSVAVAAEPPAGWLDIPPSQKWAITEQGRQGDVYQMQMVVGSCETRAECDARLPEAIHAGLLAYAEQSRPAAARNVHFPAQGFDHRVVCKDPRELGYDSENAGPRTQLHVTLQFDRDLLDDIKDQWNRAIVTQRLWYTGTGLAGLLGLLGVVYCGLVLDRATGGKRRGRLGFAAIAAAALIVFVAVAVLARMG